MLTCGCPIDDDGDWYWYQPEDYTTAEWRRRKRCKSCNELIGTGSIVIEFQRARYPKNEIELRIYDYDEAAEIELAPWFFCERCADIYWSLVELGFCPGPEDSMRELLDEYVAMFVRGAAPG